MMIKTIVVLTGTWMSIQVYFENKKFNPKIFTYIRKTLEKNPIF